MILPFSQKYKDGTPNYFPEKIISSLNLSRDKKQKVFQLLCDHNRPTQEEFLAGSCNPLWKHEPKLHTFREDKSNRWNAGRPIHGVINCRTTSMYTFVIATCKSTQEIEIIPSGLISRLPKIVVDGRTLDKAETWRLLKNDGFGGDHSLDHFNSWFTKPFSGKIVHWTDLRY